MYHICLTYLILEITTYSRILEMTFRNYFTFYCIFASEANFSLCEFRTVCMHLFVFIICNFEIHLPHTIKTSNNPAILPKAVCNSVNAANVLVNIQYSKFSHSQVESEMKILFKYRERTEYNITISNFMNSSDRP